MEGQYKVGVMVAVLAYCQALLLSVSVSSTIKENCEYPESGGGGKKQPKILSRNCFDRSSGAH